MTAFPSVQPLSHPKAHRIRHFLQLAVIASYGFMALLFPPGFALLVAISLLACPSILITELRSPRKGVAALCLCALALILLQTLVLAVPVFETPRMRWEDFFKWLLLLLGFFPLARWMDGSPGRIGLLLGSALAGLITGLLIAGNLGKILAFRHTLQTGFQLLASVAGFASGMAILGLIQFAPRLFRQAQPLKGRLIRGVTLGLAMYLSLYILVSSESRGTYLGLVLVLPYALWQLHRSNQQLAPQARRRMGFLLAGTLTLMGLGAYANQAAFRHRLEPDLRTLSALMQGQYHDLTQVNQTESSLAYRFQAQIAGFQAWRERPWLGWGPISSKALILNTGNPSLRLSHSSGKWLSHFHSGYTELLVRFGLTGLLLLLGAALWLKRRGPQLLAQAKAPEDFRIFANSGLFLLLIWGISGVFSSDDARACITILFAVNLSLMIREKDTAARMGSPQ